VATLLKVDLAEWIEAVHGQEEYFATFGNHLPQGIREEHDGLAHRLQDTMPADLHGRMYNGH
jgi:GTP-dependent phosphoenolpyruvate carboxykinase